MKHLPLKIVLFVVMSTAAFAADPMIIYAWGYGDLLYMTFQAIVYMVGGNGYVSLFKIAATIGVIAFIINAIALRGQVSLYMLSMRFAFAIFIWALLSLDSSFKANTDIQVYDVYTNSYSKIIEDVPLGFAGPIGFFSKVEYWLNHKAQAAFSITDAGIAASGSGYVPPSIGSGLIYSASQFRVTDPNLYLTMNDYITDCVFPDVTTGYFDPNDLRVSDAFWVSIADTHPARVSKVYDPDLYPEQNGHMVSCPAVWTYLNTAFTTYIPDAANYLNRSMGLSAETAYGSMLGTALDKVMGISQSGTAFLLNSVALNAFDDAVQSAAAVGGVSGEALGFGLAKSQETTRANMVLTSIQTKKYLPMTKGILMCVLLCGMPLFCAFIVAMQMPGKLLGMVIGMYLAPCFWSFGDTVLNAVVMAKASGYITNWGGISGITAQAKPVIESQAIDMVNMVSSMYGIIPTISLGFATLSGYALSSLTGSAIGSATTGVSGASSEMGSGSVSYGNVSTNNYSSNRMDTSRMLNVGQSFGYRNMYEEQTTSNIIRSGKNIYGENTIAKSTPDGGKITTTTMGGKLVKTEESVGEDGKVYGGVKFGYGTQVIGYGETGRQEVRGNTDLGDSTMILTDGKVESYETKAGATGRIGFESINLNGERFTNGSARYTGNGGAVVEGFKDGKKVAMQVNNLKLSDGDNRNYMAAGSVISRQTESVDEAKLNRDVMTLNGQQLGLAGEKNRAKITSSGDWSYIEGANANGMTYTAKVHNLKSDGRGNWTGDVAESVMKGNVESKSIDLGNGNSITTGTNGEWKHTGDGYSVYTGAVSWRDPGGEMRTGSGMVALQNGKLVKADATDGYNLLRAEKDRSEYSTAKTVDEGRSDSGILPQVLSGETSEALRRLTTAYDTWQNARGVEGKLEAYQNEHDMVYTHFAHYDSLHSDELRNGTLTKEDARKEKTALWLRRSELSQKLIPAMKKEVEALQNSPGYDDHQARVIKAEQVFDRELFAASVGTSNDFSAVLGETYRSVKGTDETITKKFDIGIGGKIGLGGKIISGVTRTISGGGEVGGNIGYSYQVATQSKTGNDEIVTINGLTDYNRYMLRAALSSGANAEQLGAFVNGEYKAVDGTLQKIKDNVGK